MKHELNFNEGLSIISHEIKNSLSGVKLGLEELDQLSKKEGKEVIRILLEELEHLHQIAMETLSLTSPLELNLEEVDIKELSKEAELVVIGNIENNRPSIKFKFMKDFPLVLCDKNLIKSVFINLLNNAYEEVGKNGVIEIGGKYLGNKMVEIWIKDNGSGIDGNKDSIFMKFKSKKGSTGIGLSLVRKIVHEHFGKISVDSTPEKGTKFIIEMPTDLHFIDRRSGKDRRKKMGRRSEDNDSGS